MSKFKNDSNYRAFVNIKCEVAKHGKVTKEAMRFYCESRLSRKQFDKAVSVGKFAFDNPHLTNALIKLIKAH